MEDNTLITLISRWAKAAQDKEDLDKHLIANALAKESLNNMKDNPIVIDMLVELEKDKADTMMMLDNKHHELNTLKQLIDDITKEK